MSDEKSWPRRGYKRKAFRKKVTFKVEIHPQSVASPAWSALGDGYQNGTGIDLSSHGAQLETFAPIEKGDVIGLKFSLAAQGKVVEALGRVVTVASLAKGKKRVGVEFTALSAAAKKYLESILMIYSG